MKLNHPSTGERFSSNGSVAAAAVVAMVAFAAAIIFAALVSTVADIISAIATIAAADDAVISCAAAFAATISFLKLWLDEALDITHETNVPTKGDTVKKGDEKVSLFFYQCDYVLR